MISWKNKNRIVSYLFLIPALVIISINTLIPVAVSFALSFFRWTPPLEPKFTGLANYLAIASDELFGIATVNTLEFVALSTPLTIGIAMLLAFLTNALHPKLGIILKGIIFVPSITSMVVTTMMWRWIYSPSLGLLNILPFIPKEGILGSTQWALVGIALMNVWKWVGYFMVMFLAGIASIPREIYECATVDGARVWKKIRYITIPLLRPVISFAVVIATIWNFVTFDPVYLLTLGGPLHATRTWMYHIYEQGFHFSHMGYAASIGFVMVTLLFIVSYVQRRYIEREIIY